MATSREEPMDYNGHTGADETGAHREHQSTSSGVNPPGASSPIDAGATDQEMDDSEIEVFCWTWAEYYQSK